MLLFGALPYPAASAVAGVLLRTGCGRKDCQAYLPIVFNFDKPEMKDFTETVRLLAGLSKFVIADITNPKSAPLELQATVPEIMAPHHYRGR
jgi:hypothetical protein